MGFGCVMMNRQPLGGSVASSVLCGLATGNIVIVQIKHLRLMNVLLVYMFVVLFTFHH